MERGSNLKLETYEKIDILCDKFCGSGVKPLNYWQWPELPTAALSSDNRNVPLRDLLKPTIGTRSLGDI